MLTFINCLILFFILLIMYQIFLAYFKIVEGLQNQTYQPYDTNNPSNALILAQQNAGNIEVLKQQIDSVMGLNKEVNDISGNVATLQDQVNGIVQAQQQYATQMSGGNTPSINGAVPDDTTSS